VPNVPLLNPEGRVLGYLACSREEMEQAVARGEFRHGLLRPTEEELRAAAEAVEIEEELADLASLVAPGKEAAMT
jgi:hypothetical protein